MPMDSPGKIQMIRETAHRFEDIDAFVETGTALGDLDLGVADIFERIVTIELNESYYLSAVNRLLPHPNVRVLHGDSAQLLGLVLAYLNEPCIIWIDAHEIVLGGYSALVAEMEALAADPHRHVLLIDDARLCNGLKGWMTLQQIETWAHRNGYAYLGVTEDVVRLVPA